jgi:hypothetical protein
MNLSSLATNFALYPQNNGSLTKKLQIVAAALGVKLGTFLKWRNAEHIYSAGSGFRIPRHYVLLTIKLARLHCLTVAIVSKSQNHVAKI